jgi:hypothetical protein
LRLEITDEAAIMAVPEPAWKPGIRQDGTVEDDKDTAEITDLMSRAENWPDGLRWIARRVKPSRRHLKNLTDYEKKTGRKYSITCTNVPDSGISGIPGSHHPQFIDVLHRDHATVETDGVRTAKAMGLRNLPSKTWQVNKGWVLAANIAADLTAWARILGLHDQEGLRDAEPDTLRYRIWHLPARPRPPRPQADPQDQPGLALERRVHHLLEPAVRTPCTRLTSTISPSHTEGGPPRHSRSRRGPGHTGQPRLPTPRSQTDMKIKNRHQYKQ